MTSSHPVFDHGHSRKLYSTPSLAVAFRIARVFGVPLEAVFRYED